MPMPLNISSSFRPSLTSVSLRIETFSSAFIKVQVCFLRYDVHIALVLTKILRTENPIMNFCAERIETLKLIGIVNETFIILSFLQGNLINNSDLQKILN